MLNQIGWGSTEMQMISYSFIILNHIQILSKFRRLLVLKVRL